MPWFVAHETIPNALVRGTRNNSSNFLTGFPIPWFVAHSNPLARDTRNNSSNLIPWFVAHETILPIL
jgi:hypothetical protein